MYLLLILLYLGNNRGMAKLTNNILLAGIVSLITWSWVSYITNWQLLAVLASMATTALYIAIVCKTKDNKTPSTKLVDSLAIHLATDRQSIQLIDNMLRYYLYDTTVDNNYILSTKEDTTYTIYCHLHTKAVDASIATSIVTYCTDHNIYKITIIASDIDSSAHTIFGYCNIVARHINIPSLYNQLQHANLLPALHPIAVNKKGIVASYALNRGRAKHYALSALFLVLISRVSFIPIYTLIWATVLMCLALYSRFNKRYNKTASANLQL